MIVQHIAKGIDTGALTIMQVEFGKSGHSRCYDPESECESQRRGQPDNEEV